MRTLLVLNGYLHVLQVIHLYTHHTRINIITLTGIMLEVVWDGVGDVEDMSHSQVLQEGLVLGLDVVAQVKAARKDLTRIGRRYETRKSVNKVRVTFSDRYRPCGIYNCKDIC